jgi:hypothetical protein
MNIPVAPESKSTRTPVLVVMSSNLSVREHREPSVSSRTSMTKDFRSFFSQPGLEECIGSIVTGVSEAVSSICMTSGCLINSSILGILSTGSIEN